MFVLSRAIPHDIMTDESMFQIQSDLLGAFMSALKDIAYIIVYACALQELDFS